MKKPLAAIYEDLDFATGQLSIQVRTLALGMLALVWAFINGNKDLLPLKMGDSRMALVSIAAICILTLTFDLLQYVAFYVSANQVRQAAEKSKATEAQYDERSPARIAQNCLFVLKLVTTLIAAAWLIGLIAATVI